MIACHDGFQSGEAGVEIWATGMVGRIRVSRWLLVAALLAFAEGASAIVLGFALVAPAQAQWFGDDGFRPRRAPRSGGFFGNLFGPYNARPQQYPGYYPPTHRAPPQPVDNSRAPPPHKPDNKGEAVVPTTSIVVMGDGMADWLAYGLEDAFSDSPEVAILRKNKLHSGLLRYDPKGDLDWWHEARDILAPEKPNYIVMMLGISDRQDIRERDLIKEAEKKAKEQKEKAEADKTKEAGAKPGEAEQPKVAAPVPPRGKKNGVVEFRSEEWEKIYTRRIDETIAALKGKGVPVFWVGLPAIRGTKSTADAVYLNDLYRARAERAGINYIDVWDGFVDDNGNFVTSGPDYEGQTRRLRSGDGVFFTKYGARKLAHYVEREVRRYMANRGPIALPAGMIGPVPGGKPAERPLAGPVLPLTVTPANSDVLLGGASNPGPRGDALATQVLVKGEPVSAPAGRADDFIWPRGSARPAPPPAAKPAAAAPIAPPVVATAPAAVSIPAAVPAENPAQPAIENPPAAPVPAAATPAPAEKPVAVAPAAAPTDIPAPPAIAVDAPAAPEQKPTAAKPHVREKTVQNAPGRSRSRRSAETRARPRNTAPRPPRPVGQQPFNGGLFGIFR